ncbi:MAG: hypothetical protein KGL31_09690 [candidate division NC10 bacterium]|nr:hypothetical protein [candidate division NC10 bacterium]MDE2322168.1 hypothetical protein [candidate division NC10 bacterium]
MRRCLGERSLLLVHYGEGRAAHLAHIETCSNCAARYRRLAQDLELIGHALERLPSALPVRRPERASWRRQVTMATALAAGVVMVVGVGVWQWRGAQVLVQRQRTADETQTLHFLADVSIGLSASSDGEVSVLPLASDRTDQEEMMLEEPNGSPREVEETWMRDSASDTDIWGGPGDAHT